jgi:hypothetical protein
MVSLETIGKSLFLLESLYVMGTGIAALRTGRIGGRRKQFFRETEPDSYWRRVVLVFVLSVASLILWTYAVFWYVPKHHHT